MQKYDNIKIIFKVPIIHRGEGHLISTMDRSISEIYKDIYNIDLNNA